MEFGQARLKKRGTPAGKLSNHLLLSQHHHTDDCETRVQHHTSPTMAIRIEAQSMVLQDYNSRKLTPHSTKGQT